MAKLIQVLLVLSCLWAGCGDDGRMLTDSGTVMDSGTSPDGSMPDGTAGGTMRTAKLRFIDQDDAPIEGVMVAIDTDMGRVEGTSDAAGEVEIDYRYMNDSTDLIAALEGYGISAFVDRPWEEPMAADGFTEITLNELGPDLGDMIHVVASATGVPTGGRWCVALISYYNVCQDEGVAWDQRLRMGQIADGVQDYVYAYALDDTGALYDFARGDWSVSADGSRSVTVDFDGTFDVTPVEQDYTINLPSDPESAYRTETLDETWQGWVGAVEPGTHLNRSAITMLSLGTDTITMRVHSFPVMGDELVWAAAPYANVTDGARTFEWYSGMPPTTIDILDLARVRSGTVWTDEFEWTESATDVERYVVQMQNGGGLVVLGMTTTNTHAQVPALPSGYDTTVTFPFPGAPGNVQVLALRGDIPPDDMASDPYRVDGEASFSLRYPITF